MEQDERNANGVEPGVERGEPGWQTVFPAIPGGTAARRAQIVATGPFVLMQGKLPVGAAKDFQCLRPGHSLGGELPDGIEGDDGPGTRRSSLHGRADSIDGDPRIRGM